MFTFEPGYYEWHLKKDGKLYFVWGDGLIDTVSETENENGHSITKAELNTIAEGEVEYMAMRLSEESDGLPEEVIENWDNQKIFSLPTEEEKQQIIEAMTDGLAAHLGVVA